MNNKLHLPLLFLAWLILCVVAHGQDKKENPITWSLQGPVAQVKVGERFFVQLSAQIEEGWHLYSLKQASNGPKPLRFKLLPEQDYELAGDIEAPKPQTDEDQNFGLETSYYEESVVFKLPVRARSKPTENKLVVEVRYQACNSEMCLPARTIKLEATITE